MPRRPRRGVEVQLYYFFNLGTRWGWVVSATPRTIYPPGKIFGTHCIGCWVGPMASLNGRITYRPNRIFYSLVLWTLSVLVSAFWLSYTLPFVFTVQHTTQISMPPAGFEPVIPASARPLGSAIPAPSSPSARSERVAIPTTLFLLTANTMGLNTVPAARDIAASLHEFLLQRTSNKLCHVVWKSSREAGSSCREVFLWQYFTTPTCRRPLPLHEWILAVNVIRFLFTHSKTKSNMNYIYRLSSNRAVNTLRRRYKNQSVNAV